MNNQLILFHQAKNLLGSNSLEKSITGVESFNFSDLKLEEIPKLTIQANLRLGHIIEQIAKQLIQDSPKYTLLSSNFQIIENNITIGELDFVIQNTSTQITKHIELAFKFYLFEPKTEEWIGPNRNDSLLKKLNKLKQKQFPLISHYTPPQGIHLLQPIQQRLCFIASLYVPINHNKLFKPEIQKHIKGYYMNFDDFKNLDNENKSYFIPIRFQWGLNPALKKDWLILSKIKPQMLNLIASKKSFLCWQKLNNTFSEFFITWW